MKNFANKNAAIFQMVTASKSFFTPWTLVISALVTITLFLGYQSNGSGSGLDKIVEILLQVTVLVFGINVIGITINHGLELNWRTASSILQQIENIISKVFSLHDHPRHSKLQRSEFIDFQCRIIGIQKLEFRDNSNENDYYIYRPNWDGAWYQMAHSPFAEFEPKGKQWPIALLHEIVICAIRFLSIIIEMQNSGCCLLSKKRGTQGTIWFIKRLQKVSEEILAIQDGKPPAILNHYRLASVGLSIWLSRY